MWSLGLRWLTGWCMMMMVNIYASACGKSPPKTLNYRKKLIASQRELQVELATSNNLAKTLTAQQDENIKLKEELVFYKNMTKR